MKKTIPTVIIPWVISTWGTPQNSQIKVIKLIKPKIRNCLRYPEGINFFIPGKNFFKKFMKINKKIGIKKTPELTNKTLDKGGRRKSGDKRMNRV